MKKKYTHEEYKAAIEKLIPDVTVDFINSIEGNEYSAIFYRFTNGDKVQITGAKLGDLNIEENARGILSIRKGYGKY